MMSWYKRRENKWYSDGETCPQDCGRYPLLISKSNNQKFHWYLNPPPNTQMQQWQSIVQIT
eukprot:3969467-Ditylum_brightwellii.AAC.1